MTERSIEAAASLTVAGPRRIRTGLPCYARRGHPEQRRVLYHGAALRIQRGARGDRLEAGGTETVGVGFLERRERRLVELDVAAPAAEQSAAVKRLAALRAALLFRKQG